MTRSFFDNAGFEDRKAGARLWQNMTEMTVDLAAASERWRVIGLDGTVLANNFETSGAAEQWARLRF